MFALRNSPFPKLLRGSALLLALCLLVMASPTLAQSNTAFDSQSVREAVQRVYESHDFQAEFPQDDEVSEKDRQSDQEGEESQQRQRDLPQQREGLKIPAAWQEAIKNVLLVVGVIGILLLAYFLVKELPALRRRKDPSLPEAPVKSEPAAKSRHLHSGLEEADRLAQEEQFAQAIHHLLLHALEVLMQKLRGHLPLALTSREILRQTQLSQIAKQALTALVRDSERCYFGSRCVDQADYARARASFEAFRSAWQE